MSSSDASLHGVFLCLMALLTSPFVPTHPAMAYVIPSQNAITAHSSFHHPTSALASKVIYESPSMGQIYKEFLVTSKPLNLRKYSNGMKKTKKSKKDSKIYFIPMPPMPYRYIPGVGYDYQPMKIKPIMKDAPPPKSIESNPQTHRTNVGYGFPPPMQQQHHMNLPTTPISSTKAPESSSTSAVQMNKIADFATNLKDSKIIRLDLSDYFFNGRPFRLQAAHAQPKHQLTPQNLKTKFFFNKNIIY